MAGKWLAVDARGRLHHEREAETRARLRRTWKARARRAMEERARLRARRWAGLGGW